MSESKLRTNDPPDPQARADRRQPGGLQRCFENGVVVGRIFFLMAVAPEGRPWIWASGHSADSIRRAAHGYQATREAAMAAFAKSWRGVK